MSLPLHYNGQSTLRQLNICNRILLCIVEVNLRSFCVFIDLPTNFALANLVEVVNLQEQATQSDSVKCGSCVETCFSV